MFRKRRVPLYTHQLEQDYSNRILRIKTQLELYNDLKQISDDLPTNPQIMQLKMITQKKIIEDIAILQKTGFDITSLIATFGVKLLKAEIIDADNAIAAKQAVASSDAGVVVDLVPEDNILRARAPAIIVPRDIRRSRIAAIMARRAAPRARSQSPQGVAPEPLIAPQNNPLDVTAENIQIPQQIEESKIEQEEQKSEQQYEYSEEVAQIMNDSDRSKYTIRKDAIAEKYITNVPKMGNYPISQKVSAAKVTAYIKEKQANNEPVDLTAISFILAANQSYLYNTLKKTGRYDYLRGNDAESRMKAVFQYVSEQLLESEGIQGDYTEFVQSNDPNSYFLTKIQTTAASTRRR